MNKVTILLYIIISALIMTAADAAVPETPEAALRRENARLRSELLQRSKELEDLKLYLATITSGGGVQKSSEREKNALAALDKLSRTGMDMALKVDTAVRELRAIVRLLKLSDLQQTQINLRLDAMEKAVSRYLLFARGSKKESCNVLAIERTLGIVVISAGLDQGIFPGMVFRPRQGNSSIRLRVIAVKQEIAATELIAGAWEDITPGMEVTAFFRSNK